MHLISVRIFRHFFFIVNFCCYFRVAILSLINCERDKEINLWLYM